MYNLWYFSSPRIVNMFYIIFNCKTFSFPWNPFKKLLICKMLRNLRFLFLANNFGISNCRSRCLSTLWSRKNKKIFQGQSYLKKNSKWQMKKLQEMENEQGEQEPMTLSTTYMNSVVHIQRGGGREPRSIHSDWFLSWVVFIMVFIINHLGL